MTKAVRRIKKFDFTGEGAHVALVDKAANGQSVLIMKSAHASDEEISKALSRDVTVQMTIWEFLTRYLRVDWDAAEVIAGILGYSAEDIDNPYSDEPKTWVERIQERIDAVTIHKSVASEQFLEKFEQFVSKHLNPDLSSSVASEGGDIEVTKAEDESTNNEVDPQMSEKNEITQKSIEEMVAKAAQELAKEQVAALEKAYAAKAEEATRELQVLKAAHEARVHQEYLTKAAGYSAFLGEDADNEAVAKALRAVEALEEAAPLLDVLKSLKSIAEKGDLLVEVGKSATEEQPSDTDSKALAIAKSLREADPSLTQRQAEMKAYEQLYAQ